jgi:hypothetical protein
MTSHLRVSEGPSSPTRPQVISANQSESAYARNRLLSHLASGDGS